MAHRLTLWIRRLARRPGPALLAGLLPALVAGTAGAQSFDPASLSAPDRGFIQQMLETERSNVARELPSSRDVVTIVRTETQPRICRYFVIQATAGGQRDGVGCRVEGGVWQLGPSVGQLVATGAPPAATISSGPRVEGTIGIAPSGSGASASTVTELEVRDDPSTWEEIPVPQRRPGTAGTTLAAAALPSTASTTVDPSIFIRNAPEPPVEDAETETQTAGAPFVPPLPVRRPGTLGTSAAIALAQQPVTVAGDADEGVEAQGDTDADEPAPEIAASGTAAATIAAGPPVGSDVADATGTTTVAAIGGAAISSEVAALPEPSLADADEDANVQAGTTVAGPLPLPVELATVPLPGRRP